MPRANRFFRPGYVWHITQGCHNKSFLLKFAHDRTRWIYWLYQAKKRFGLSVLNYIVTSNHIHLLVHDTGGDIIPNSLKLISGQTAREYNQRKRRKGSFWEDRYHATAIETGSHLHQCIVYIDLNMVRAGVVNHPEEWPHSGYHEIQHPNQRYQIIDQTSLLKLCETNDPQELIAQHQHWIKEALQHEQSKREGRWTNALAVGSENFVNEFQSKQGIRAKYRMIKNEGGQYTLNEPVEPYKLDFKGEKAVLSQNKKAIEEVG